MINFAEKDTMSALERIMALIAGQSTDRIPFIPFSIGFSAKIHGIDRGTFYRNPEKAFEAGLHLMREFPWMNTVPVYGWADRGAWEFGGRIFWPDANRYPAPFSEPAISKPDEVDALPVPDPLTAGANPLFERFDDICRHHGFTASLPGGTPTTFTAGALGRETFFRWMVKYPEALHKLQRKATDFIIRTAELTIKKHGAENCSLLGAFPMESNQLIAPGMFESFALPYIREIYDYYASEGIRSVIMHLCGDHTGNLSLFKTVSLPPRTIFSIGHEMDLEATGQAIGWEHILGGNVNTGILHKGTPEEVFEEVVRCMEAGRKHPGGFILMPACEFPPDTPEENVDALAHALFERGYCN